MPEISGFLHRADDRELVKSALRVMGSKVLVDVIFGGLLDGNELFITDQHGGRTRSVLGQRVRVGEGLGGQAMQRSQPLGVANYLESDKITHMFDSVIRTEGLCTMAAVPIVVRGASRGVLYASTRDRYHLGPSILREFQQAAAAISYELQVRDEVDRRLSMLRVADSADIGKDQDLTESVREIHAELISMSQLADDKQFSDRLYELAMTLSPVQATPGATSIKLSKRQTDVLSQVALGCEYAEVGRRLGLQLVTVRSYMRAIMAKLEARNRVEAVAIARRYRLIP